MIQKQTTTQISKLINNLERVADELAEINQTLIILYEIYNESKNKKRKNDKR